MNADTQMREFPMVRALRSPVCRRIRHSRPRMIDSLLCRGPLRRSCKHRREHDDESESEDERDLDHSGGCVLRCSGLAHFADPCFHCSHGGPVVRCSDELPQPQRARHEPCQARNEGPPREEEIPDILMPELKKAIPASASRVERAISPVDPLRESPSGQPKLDYFQSLTLTLSRLNQLFYLP